MLFYVVRENDKMGTYCSSGGFSYTDNLLEAMKHRTVSDAIEYIKAISNGMLSSRFEIECYSLKLEETIKL